MNPTRLVDIRDPRNYVVPASWPSASIVDARAFSVGESRVVHAPTHAGPNVVRGACGVTAHVVERDSRLAYWRDALIDCPTCLNRGRR